MKNLYRLAILCIGLAPQFVAAQSGKLKRANEFYDHVSYALAAQTYEELLGSDVDSPQMRARLAYSYYQMGNPVKAEMYYAQMITSPEATAEDLYRYAQALKENGKYGESDKWMVNFSTKYPNDQRAVEFRENDNYMQMIAKQGVHFTIDTVAVNTKEADFGGYPAPNGKVYFLSSRNDYTFVHKTWTWNNQSFLDVYSAERSGRNLRDPKLFSTKVNTRFHEGPMCFSPDGKKVYFTRNNISKGSRRKDAKGLQQLKMYVADVDANGSWVNEKEFKYNDQSYSVGHPSITTDGKTLYYASSRNGGQGGADIYKVEILGNGDFGPEINLGDLINTPGQDMFPWISPDGTLFFSSDGQTGLGGLDVYVVLTNKDGAFSKVINAGNPVNTRSDDFAFSMSSDGLSGFFSSNREGGKGDDDIYSYLLTKPFKTSLLVNGVASEKGSDAVLPESSVFLLSSNGDTLARTLSGKDGSYSFEVEPEKRYRIHAGKKSYFDNDVTFTTISLPEGTEVVERGIDLEKDPGLALRAVVVEAGASNPMEGVKITITDNITREVFIQTITNATGDVMKGLAGKKVSDNLSYTIKLEKAGYLTKTVQFNTKILKPGIINVHESMDLTMTKVSVGADLASLIEIKPIYFDLGKYAIRPDAAKELDKIVKVMNDYPTMEVELGSHTDCRGSIASNEKLSDNRAKASAAYIQSKITDPKRISGRGYGEAKLKNGCACEGAVKSTCSEAEHQENRRTEFIIMKM